MLVKAINILLARTYTSDQLVERLGLLRDHYGAVLFKGASPVAFEEMLSPETDAYTRGVLRELIKAFARAEITDSQLYQAIPEIEWEVSRLPTTTVYVPVRFPPEELERLGQWFRTHVQPNILLTVRVDARVAGGCAVVWNNHYHDFSLRYYMRKHRAEIVSMFDRHTTQYAA